MVVLQRAEERPCPPWVISCGGRGRGGDYSSRGGDRHRRSSPEQVPACGGVVVVVLLGSLQLLDAEAAAILLLPRRTGGSGPRRCRNRKSGPVAAGEGMAAETGK